MRVATWNLWHRFGADWQARGKAIAATLQTVDADVVCLQEAWTEEATGRSQAGDLAAALGLEDFADGFRITWEGVTFGNAVLSRWPITRRDARPLPPHPDYEEYRNVLAVEVDTADGPAQFFTTHFNFLRHQSAVRQAQARAVGQMMVAWAHDHLVQPQVLTGDLNAGPDSDEVRMLTGHADLGVDVALLDAWAVAGDGPGHTWDNANPLAQDSHEPDRRIDHILVGLPRPFDGRGTVQQCALLGDEPVDGVWPSDHLGVVAELADTPGFHYVSGP